MCADGSWCLRADFLLIFREKVENQEKGLLHPKLNQSKQVK